MGKGDLRSRRGKIYRGTHGNTRSRKKEKTKEKRRRAAARAAAAPPGAAPK